MVCARCNSLLDASQGFSLIKSGLFNSANAKPISKIQLGTVFQFEGNRYVAINRTRWRSLSSEYWEESGEKGYEKTRWIYDEWCMRANDGSIIYISEDNYEFGFSKILEPKFPNLPKYQQLNDFANNTIRTVQEEGYATLEYFEGESEDIPAKGDKVFFGYYTASNINYIVEWEKDELSKPANIQFFKEAVVPRSKMSKHIFHSPDQVRIENFEVVNPLGSELKKLCKVLSFIAMFLCMVFCIFSCMKDPVPLFEASFPEVDTVNYRFQDVDNKYVYTSRFPITLEEKYTVYKAAIWTNDLLMNSETEGELRILNNSFTEVLDIVGDFYRETSEGETEQSTEASKYFTVTEPSSYFLEITVPKQDYQNITFHVKIEKDVLLSRYFGAGILVFFVLGTYVFAQNGRKKLVRHVGMLTSK
jgi:hypothetical protein